MLFPFHIIYDDWPLWQSFNIFLLWEQLTIVAMLTALCRQMSMTNGGKSIWKLKRAEEGQRLQTKHNLTTNSLDFELLNCYFKSYDKIKHLVEIIQVVLAILRSTNYIKYTLLYAAMLAEERNFFQKHPVSPSKMTEEQLETWKLKSMWLTG